ncbi:MAG: serine protease [Verrucomicrobiales bacterium]|nr:serine protease [Verrucomicrobiales bacterium]
MMKIKSLLYPLLSALAICKAIGGDQPPGKAEHILHSTFKLFNPGSTATCFLIHRDGSPDNPVIISAAHVFEKMKGETAILVLRKKDNTGRYKRHDHKIRIRKKEEKLWTRHPEQDIAALPLNGKTDDIPCPSLSTERLADSKRLKKEGITICDSVFVLCYPERTEANPGGFPVARHATIASFPLSPVKHYPSFMLDFNTFGGDSGGPVFIKETHGKAPLIIGIATAQYRYDETVRMLNEERSVHHPLGLSKVIHSQFILDTIALLPNEQKTP